MRLNDDEAKKVMQESLLRIEAMALVHQRLYDSDRMIEVNIFTYIPKLTSGILRSYNQIKLKPDYHLENFWLHVDQIISLGLILNELITNACKYAFANNPIPELSIECWQVDSIINLRVTDNGSGFDSTVQHKSFGLKLIQVFSERLKANYSFSNHGRMFHMSFKKKVIDSRK